MRAYPSARSQPAARIARAEFLDSSRDAAGQKIGTSCEAVGVSYVPRKEDHVARGEHSSLLADPEAAAPFDHHADLILFRVDVDWNGRTSAQVVLAISQPGRSLRRHLI
jgi:hypothetical protein